MGPELIEKFRAQAIRFGTQIFSEDVQSVRLDQYPFIVKGHKTHCKAEALIIATGATAKRLEIPGANDGEFWQTRGKMRLDHYRGSLYAITGAAVNYCGGKHGILLPVGLIELFFEHTNMLKAKQIITYLPMPDL